MTFGVHDGGKSCFPACTVGYDSHEHGAMQSAISDAKRASLDSAKGHEQNQHARSQEQVSMAQQPVQTHHSPS